MPSFIGQVVDAFESNGVDLAAWGLAWARVAPTVALVPAFGLRALPDAARGAIALSLALVVAPSVHPGVLPGSAWPLAFLAETARGLPVALAAAIPLWAATMVGATIDTLRGTSQELSVPVVEGRTTPLGVLYSLLASLFFLAGGGPARVTGALVAASASAAVGHPFERAALDIASGIDMAVAIAAPIAAAAIVVEVTGALVARAASPAQVHALLAPVRSLLLLGAAGLLLTRMAALLAEWVAR